MSHDGAVTRQMDPTHPSSAASETEKKLPGTVTLFMRGPRAKPQSHAALDMLPEADEWTEAAEAGKSKHARGEAARGAGHHPRLTGGGAACARCPRHPPLISTAGDTNPIICHTTSWIRCET